MHETTRIEMVTTRINRNALKLPEGFERVQLDAIVNPTTKELHIPALNLWFVQPSIDRKQDDEIVPLELPPLPEDLPRRPPMCTPRRIDVIPVIGQVARRVERAIPVRRTFAWDTPEQPRPRRPARVAPVRRQAPPLIAPRTMRNAALLPWLASLALLFALALILLALVGFDPRAARMTVAPNEPEAGYGGPTAARWVYDTCPNSMATQLSFSRGTDIIGNLDGEIREVFSAEKAGTAPRDLHALCAHGPDGDWVPVTLDGENVYMRESSLTAYPWDVSSGDSDD